MRNTISTWHKMLSQSFDPRDWFADNQSPCTHSIHGGGTKKMWVYMMVTNKFSEWGHTETYEVGFFSPTGEWHRESAHPTAEEAANRVRYLNGGS